MTRLRRRLTSKLRACLAGGWAALLLAGCGPAAEPGLVVQMHLPPAERLPAGLRGTQPPGKGEFPPLIDDFRLCVTAPDMEKPRCDNFNRDDYLAAGKARLGGIPAGSGRKVTFQGFDFERADNDRVLWCGEVDGVEIVKDGTTRVEMFITACSNFTYTRGDLERGRFLHTATRLPDGRVLIAGGFAVVLATEPCSEGTCLHLSATDSLELYDPRAGTFTSLPGANLSAPRALHSATLLPDGRVLIAGGCQEALWYTSFNLARPPVEIPADGWGTAGTTADIVTIAGDNVSVQAVGAAMTSLRALHAALPQENGDVLLAGGLGLGNQPLGSLTRYQAAGDGFEDLAVTLQAPRQAAAVVELEQGSRWLLWGGNTPQQAGAGVFAEVIDVAADGSVQTSQPAFVSGQASRGLPVFGGGAARFGDKQLLVAGGLLTDTALHPNLTKPEVLRLFRVVDFSGADPTITRPAADTATMRYFRALHSASRLARPMALDDAGERVLLAGGFTASGVADLDLEPQNTAEFFLSWETDDSLAFVTPQLDSITIQMNEARAGHSATQLDDGTVLLVGGLSGRSPLVISATAEIFNPRHRNLRVE